jgi:drug/metabolite transporter (DMT)-like permease
MNKNNSNFSLFDLLNNQPQMFRGVVWMLLATFAAACQNSLVKFVSDDLPVVEMLLVRSLISLSIFLPVVIKTGFEPVKTNRLGFHCFRGGVHSLAQLLFFYALAVTPLATVAALNFTGPLFSTLMAALFLGEVIRARRITAMAIGFAGAMVILRPGFIEMDLGAVATIVSAFFLGRLVGLHESPVAHRIQLNNHLVRLVLFNPCILGFIDTRVDHPDA